MSSFMTGVCLTMFIGAILDTENIKTLEDARRVYGLIAITVSGLVFFTLFTVMTHDEGERPTR